MAHPKLHVPADDGTPYQTGVSAEAPTTATALAEAADAVWPWYPPLLVPRKMHSLSRATGLAIARLLAIMEDGGSQRLEEADLAIVPRIAAFAECARVNLRLDSTTMTNAVMFFQPLLRLWPTSWKYTYTIAVILSAKFTLAGFYVTDVVDYLTTDFSLHDLKRGERLALDAYTCWAGMHERCESFRNALIHVALEICEPADEFFAAFPVALLPGEDQVDPVRVLIIDASFITREQHRSLVLAVCPTAVIMACTGCATHNVQTHTRSSPAHACGLVPCLHSVPQARAVLRTCAARGEQVHLVLTGLLLSAGREKGFTGGEGDRTSGVLAEENGFEIVRELHRADALPRSDFLYRPVVAMVTSHVAEVLEAFPLQPNGAVNGCDVLLSKPLGADRVRVLLECCVV